MKHVILLNLFLFSSILLFSQSYPVAIVDTVSAKLGDTITVNIMEKSYHPDGLSFWIDYVSGEISHTDSTITYYFDYDTYYNINGTKRFGFKLIDENGGAGYESYGFVFINIINDYCDTLDLNNIQALVTPWANQFCQGPRYWSYSYENDSLFHFEYPKGSGKRTMFNSSFWIGGYDQNNQLRVSAEKYRQNGIDFWSGPLSFGNDNLGIDSATVYEWHKLWKLNRSEIVFHRNNWWKPGYIAIENIANWPAHGDEEKHQSKYLAPFIDVDGDGYYDPYSGDYPLIKGDQCVFFIFNDFRLDERETKGKEIGIDVHAMMYQFAIPGNDVFNNTVFLSYKIFNRSENTLTDTYIGIYTDIDLGYPCDDYMGCDVERGMYYGYNGEDIDGNGELVAYGENPPAQGILFLGGPDIDSNNIDDPDGGCDESINGVGFGDGIIDNERYGMTSFVYYNNGGNHIQCDPDVYEEYYNYMKAVWIDGTPMEYGNTGHPYGNSYGPSCKFMFPGLTDSCFWGTDGIQPNGLINWCEETANQGNPNPPGDRRGLGSMGPFTFLPGTMQKIDIAYVVARGEDGPISSVELLKVYADSLRAQFVKNSDDFGSQYLDVKEDVGETTKLKVYPNPVGGLLNIENPINSEKAEFAIYDIYGRLLLTGKINSLSTTQIDVSGLESGVYFVKVHNEKYSLSTQFVKK